VGSFDEESQRSKYRGTVPLNRKNLREFEHNSKEISVEWLFTCSKLVTMHDFNLKTVTY
jgi:hypothetical protein